MRAAPSLLVLATMAASHDSHEHATGASRPRATRQPIVVRMAATAVVVAAGFVAAMWAKPVLIPLALAILLHLVLNPLVRALKRLRIPALWGSFLVVGSGLAIAVVLVLQLAGPALEWTQRLPRAAERLEQRVRGLAEPMRQLSQASESVQKIGAVPTDAHPVQVEVLESAAAAGWIERTGELLAFGAMTTCLLFFLLASDGSFLRKVVRLMPTLRDKKVAVETAHRIENDMSTYLSSLFAIGVCLGVAEGLAMWLMGMPNPVLWGLMACALIWVPYAGALAGTFIVALVASTSFDDRWSIVLPPLVYGTLTVIEGSLITPLVMGRKLTLNPLIALVWVALWGWMWGVVGALIAIPMLTTLRIVASRTAGLSALSEFLGAGDISSASAPLPAEAEGALARGESR